MHIHQALNSKNNRWVPVNSNEDNLNSRLIQKNGKGGKILYLSYVELGCFETLTKHRKLLYAFLAWKKCITEKKLRNFKNTSLFEKLPNLKKSGGNNKVNQAMTVESFVFVQR